MLRSSSIYALTALLSAALLFSCAPEIEPIPDLDEQNNSSSDTEQPPLPPPNRPSSSSTAFAQSSSSQQPPISSPTQSSSSAAPKSSSSNAPPQTSSPTTQSSSSQQPPNSSPAQSSSSVQSPPISSPAQSSSSEQSPIQPTPSSSSEQPPTPPISSSNSVQKYMADEVYCVNKTGGFDCTLNDKAISYGELKLTNSSEGCMDIEIDWQDPYYPGTQGPLNIMLGCNYRGNNGVGKTCKLISKGKELRSVTTNNNECQIQAISIGKISGVSHQSFPEVCMRVTEGGEEKYTGITCRLQVYKLESSY